jgi:hypothetical protein
MAFLQFLHGMQKTADAIYNDGGIVVYKVGSDFKAASHD